MANIPTWRGRANAAPNFDFAPIGQAIEGFNKSSQNFGMLADSMLERDKLLKAQKTNVAIANALRNGGNISQITTDPNVDTQALYDVLAKNTELTDVLKTNKTNRIGARSETAVNRANAAFRDLQIGSYPQELAAKLAEGKANQEQSLAAAAASRESGQTSAAQRQVIMAEFEAKKKNAKSVSELQQLEAEYGDIMRRTIFAGEKAANPNKTPEEWATATEDKLNIDLENAQRQGRFTSALGVDTSLGALTPLGQTVAEGDKAAAALTVRLQETKEKNQEKMGTWAEQAIGGNMKALGLDANGQPMLQDPSSVPTLSESDVADAAWNATSGPDGESYFKPSDVNKDVLKRFYSAATKLSPAMMNQLMKEAAVNASDGDELAEGFIAGAGKLDPKTMVDKITGADQVQPSGYESIQMNQLGTSGAAGAEDTGEDTGTDTSTGGFTPESAQADFQRLAEFKGKLQGLPSLEAIKAEFPGLANVPLRGRLRELYNAATKGTPMGSQIQDGYVPELTVSDQLAALNEFTQLLKDNREKKNNKEAKEAHDRRVATELKQIMQSRQ